MLPSKSKSRTFRRKRVKTPGGRVVIQFDRRNPQTTKCAICKKELHGIPRKLPSKFRNLPKSKKVISRPFGGNLCSSCSREKIKEITLKNVNVNR